MIGLTQCIMKNEYKSWDVIILEKNLSAIELTRWLFSKDKTECLKLDLTIDLEEWKTEMSSVEDWYVNYINPCWHYNND